MNSEELKELIASFEAGTWEPTGEEEEKLLTDEMLDMWESGKIGVGYQRAATHLRSLHVALRRIAISEGVINMNMGGGGTYSQAVAYGVSEVKAGRCENIERNQAVIRNDPHGTKASAAAQDGVSHAAYLRSVGAGG